MNHRETVNAVARKLRHISRRDVSALLDVLIEVWSDELIRANGDVRIKALGKLYVEQQTIPISGVIRRSYERRRKVAPSNINRYYFRFRPTPSLYKRLKAQREARKEQDS